MQTISLNITGMSCNACQTHVKHALERVEDVENAEVDLSTHSAIVQGSDIDVNDLIEAVEEEGYGAQAR